MLGTVRNSLQYIISFNPKTIYEVRFITKTLSKVNLKQNTVLSLKCKCFHNIMSNENLSYLISSSKTCFLPFYLPYPFNIAEIRMHLTFSVFVYCNSVCVCVCPTVINLVTHFQKKGSSAVTAIMESGSMFYSLTLINQMYTD